ncbi:MAG: histidine phosphatase family protein [Oscillospiraceae bacterium]|nr:histidine phosphatase family protein [Oscillospiraceae bacterium]
MISYKIHLIRSGSASEGHGQLLIGQEDLPLSRSGQEKLERLQQAGGYPQVDRLYASPLARCLQTAEILYPGYSTHQVEGLKDTCLGEFEGKSFEQLKDLPAFTAWLHNSQASPPPGGENVEDFMARVSAALDGVVRGMMRERITSAGVITHGGVIMTLMAAVALPRLPIHQWAVAHGQGYTLLTSAQLWMQGGCAEAFALLPERPEATE